jgi:thioredoxin 1
MSEVVLENREDLKRYLSATTHETTILKLTASWCGPCKKIAPYVSQLNNHYSKNYDMEYIEIDVDESLDLYAFFKKMKMANGVPTFLVYKKNLYHPDSYYVPYRFVSGGDPRTLEDFYKSSF